MLSQEEFISINVAIITISDTRDINNDKSGDTLVKKISESGHKIMSRDIVKDDFDKIHNLFSCFTDVFSL